MIDLDKIYKLPEHLSYITDFKNNNKYNSLVTEILNYIYLKINKINSIKDLEQVFNHNYQYLSHIFQKEFNVSFNKYIMTQKMIFLSK